MKLRPQALNFVDPVHHLFVLPLPGLKELTPMEVYCLFLYVSVLQKLFKICPIVKVPVTAVLGSPLVRGGTNLYKMSSWLGLINPYPTAFPYGNGMVLHFYQQQESSTTKTVHKVINKGLKTYV